MAFDFRLPKLGAEMATARLSEWLVAPGDQVAEGEAIAVVETDKVETELEAPVAGFIQPRAQPGEDYAVGDLLATISEFTERPDDAQEVPLSRPPDAAQEPTGTAATDAPPTPHHPTAAAERVRWEATERRRGEPFASPLARKLAKQHNLSLAELATAVGDGRALRQADVEAAIRNRAPAPPPPAQPREPSPVRGRIAGLSPMRHAIARRMRASLRETAQITDVREHDVSALVELRNSALRWEGLLGFHLSYTDLIVRAAALALRAVPELNSALNEEEQLVRFDEINIGVAVSLPHGLVVPVVKGADRLSLRDLHTALDELITHARERKSTAEELSGGTFTVTNIGSYGSHFATPILVPGQVGILATGAFLSRPVIRDGQVRPGTIMHTSVTIDHAVLDGRTAGEFQNTLAALFAEPDRLL